MIVFGLFTVCRALFVVLVYIVHSGMKKAGEGIDFFSSLFLSLPMSESAKVINSNDWYQYQWKELL